MKTICAIRTNKWDENAERLFQQLSPVFGDDLVVIFHDRPAEVVPPLPCADINRRWVRRHGLARPIDWGWRCGDYFYFRLREAYPDYDHYWLIEPDVFFRGDVGAFFGAFDNHAHDMLTYRLVKLSRSQSRFARRMPMEEIRRAIFALTRFSGRALDFLLAERQAFSLSGEFNRFYPNDEIFSMSHVCAHPEFSQGDMEAIAPEWFETSYFDTAPDILADSLREEDAAPTVGVFHPVHEKRQFKDAVAKRLVGGNGFLARMNPSLSHLDQADAEDIVATVSAALFKQLSPLTTGKGAVEPAKVKT
ncbi:MAG: component of SufBCD complex [Pikeienuella sp.]